MDDVSRNARRLAGAIEPFAGQVYFSPECHDAYAALGFDPSPGDFAGVAAPEMHAYFCSRGGVMGQVPGSVIAAAFGVFEPTMVAGIVAHGWTIADAEQCRQARDDGAVGQLRRLLGDAPDGADEVRAIAERAVAALSPEGKPLFAGQIAQPRFDDPLADAWRLTDALREYRGDVHTASWVIAGLDACRLGLLTERWWGMPFRSYSRTRMWNDDQYAAAMARLEADGLVAGDDLTDAGRDFREEVEVATDRANAPVLDAIGDDLDRFCTILEGWGVTIRAGKGYPAGGPHDLG